MTNLGDQNFTSGNNIIENNIIANSGGGIQALTGNNSGANTIQHNLFYGNAANGTTGTNVVTGNPSFVGPTLTPPNLNIQAGSAAIDAGMTLSQVPTDIAGTPRPQGAGYDIGAYEFASGQTPINPPQSLKMTNTAP
ncbi:MAG TPA: choice-of-anchor Q domain-containing protein [Geobacteraceae bacterium]|nr:choice-of-anchor Q domain-containing protein [Geobacteraceae bacterium]